MSNDKWRRPNAYRHGVFSRTAIVPGEDPEEFEGLHLALTEELAPDGALEFDAVLSIAKAMWRKRRAQKFIQQEVIKNAGNPRHSGYNEYESLAAFASNLRAVPDNFEDYANRLLYADKVKYLTDKFPRSKYKSSQARAEAVIKEVETIMMPKVSFGDDPAVLLMYSSETFTAEFFDNELRLDERLDIMIDRAVKRLIQIKAMKQMLGQMGTERRENQVRRISVKKAASG